MTTPNAAQSQVEHLVDLTATLTARVKAASSQDARDQVRAWATCDPRGLPLTEITVNRCAVVESDGAATNQPGLHDALDEALREAERAKYGDSNDGEISALNDALDEALSLLGCSRPTLTDEEIRAVEEGE